MAKDGVDELLAGLGPRRVVVVSDRYPPDDAGGAERSLHLLLREPALRDQAVVVSFDKALPRPLRRTVDGVAVIALPAPAAWPLHRLSQAEVDALKRRPYGLKWASFIAEAAGRAVARPEVHAPALALWLAGAPAGGVRMAHATVPESSAPAGVRAVIDRLRPALVHADNARSIMVAACAVEGTGTPLMAVVRDHRFTSPRFDQTFDPLEDQLSGWRRRLAESTAASALGYRRERLARASLVVATSAELESSLAGLAPRLRREPLVPVESWPEQAAARPSDEGFRILVVGSLTRNKGQLHLLEGWSALAGRVPGVSIDFAGGGPDYEDLSRLAAGPGLSGRVRVHGRVAPAALGALYAAADVVALPTLWREPFGRVPLEAGAAGRPVVAYASGGLAETVIDGVNGRLVPAGDRAAFIDALAELAGDPALAARMGAEGKAKAAGHAPARLAARLAALWDEAAGT